MGNRRLYGRTTTLMPALSSRCGNILLIYVLEYICQTTQKTHMLSDKQVENLVVIPKFHLLEAGYYAGKQTKESSLPIYRNIRLNTLFKLISIVFIGNMKDELSWPQKTFTPLNYLFHPGKLHKMNLLSFWKWPFFLPSAMIYLFPRKSVLQKGVWLKETGQHKYLLKTLLIWNSLDNVCFWAWECCRFKGQFCLSGTSIYFMPEHCHCTQTRWNASLCKEIEMESYLTQQDEALCLTQ